MDRKDKIIAALAGIIVLAVGFGLGWAGEYHAAVQVPREKQQAQIQQQQEQLQKESRSGKLVSFNGNTVTVAVDAGGAEVGKNATYNLTQYTNVQKDYAMVSKYGQQPDLGALGVKAGYYVNLLVNSGNVVDLQFNSNGGKTAVQGGPVSGGPAPLGSRQ